MIEIDNPTGLWIPLVTPFRNGTLDEASLRRLVKHYSAKRLGGIILGATTGEGQLLSTSETDRLIAITAEELSEQQVHQKLYLGVSGSNPVEIIDVIERTASSPIQGYLVSGPNYLRPSQDGLVAFYTHVARSTDKSLILYNIPYRTGVNIENSTLLKLARLEKIVGVKDCCGNAEQSYELLRKAPAGFSVMTGEDPFFYNAMANGAPGAIVTGAHVLVDEYLKIIDDFAMNKQKSALETWNSIAKVPRLLFEEPSPAPVKFWLREKELIDSMEVRLPFMPVSDGLAAKLKKLK